MGYEILEHTADVRLLVRAENLKEIFSEALKGMREIIKPESEGGKGAERKISISAPDTTALLIDFLNEVLFNLYTYKEDYQEVEFEELTESSLRAILRGKAAESFGEDIKAVSYHEAEVKRNEEGKWETILVFDI